MRRSDSVGVVNPRHAACVVVGASVFAAAAPAVAQERKTPLRLEVATSCPTRGLVARELAPLLPEHAVAADDEEARVSARVEDFGDSYKVSIGGASRTIDDPERRCLERARVAAVFIGMNLPEQAAPARPPPSSPVAPPAPEPLPVVETPTEPERSLRLRAFAFTEGAPEAEVVMTGAGLGLALVAQPLSLTLSGGIGSPARPETGYELLRAPFALLGGAFWRVSSVDLGVEVGLALDLLRFRGERVPNPDEQLRINPGARLSALLRLRPSPSFAAVLIPGAAYHPRTYEVRVEPTRFLGETPRWWFGAQLGLEYRIAGR